MGRNKLIKFEDNSKSYNVIQPGKAEYEKIKGNWRRNQFKNENDIVLELACGYGEYSIGLARNYPARNFVGIDIKGSRIWKGSKIAQSEKLNNVAFLRCQIQSLPTFFAPGEVNDIWIVFPDPRPRNREMKKRLTHPRYLDIYKEILTSGGILRLKTDNDVLFDYSLEVIAARKDIKNLQYSHNLYESPLQEDHFDIKTRYERLFTSNGSTIKYLKFNFE